MGRGAVIPDRDRGMSDSRQSGSDHAPPRYAVVVYAEDSATFVSHHPGRTGGSASNRGEIGVRHGSLEAETRAGRALDSRETPVQSSFSRAQLG
jgi:hypothetical protein